MSNTTIHEYNDYGYYTGNSMVINEKGAIPPYWTAAPFPIIPAGQYAVFDGVSWSLTATPQPIPPDPPPSPIEVEKAAVANALPASATVI
jgi:hypothetical protein